MASSSANIGNDLLWRECAGDAVKVPRVGDRVFYFPQGHLEHVAAHMNAEPNAIIPNDGLPSKILCKVVDVRLKAEPDTEELVSEIILRPDNEEDVAAQVSTIRTTVPQYVPASSFRKILTGYDVSTHGGLTLRKNDARNTFPSLDLTQDCASDVVVKDIHGTTWHFQHVYRARSNRHYLTTGWNKFVSEKRLLAGDTCIFIRWENEIYIGVRRAVRMNKEPLTDLPYPTIQYGIIADARVSIHEKTNFTVYYHPRESSSQFIVSYDKVVESVKINYSRGMRFEMLSDGGREDVDYAVNTLTGTITEVGDVDPIRWRGSEWRCLMVRWGWGAALVPRPGRVSPWSIRPFNLAVRR